MTPIERHRALDEIVAGYLLEHSRCIANQLIAVSKISALDLLEWHYEKVEEARAVGSQNTDCPVNTEQGT